MLSPVLYIDSPQYGRCNKTCRWHNKQHKEVLPRWISHASSKSSLLSQLNSDQMIPRPETSLRPVLMLSRETSQVIMRPESTGQNSGLSPRREELINKSEQSNTATWAGPSSNKWIDRLLSQRQESRLLLRRPRTSHNLSNAKRQEQVITRKSIDHIYLVVELDLQRNHAEFEFPEAEKSGKLSAERWARKWVKEALNLDVDDFMIVKNCYDEEDDEADEEMLVFHVKIALLPKTDTWQKSADILLRKLYEMRKRYLGNKDYFGSDIFQIDNHQQRYFVLNFNISAKLFRHNNLEIPAEFVKLFLLTKIQQKELERK